MHRWLFQIHRHITESGTTIGEVIAAAVVEAEYCQSSMIIRAGWVSHPPGGNKVYTCVSKTKDKH